MKTYKDGDVLLILKENGIDININNGLIEMTGGFETAIILSLFGGNDQDDGTESTKKYEFWGNKLENDQNKKLISRTGGILTGLPVTPNNLRLIDQAIQLDLNWMKTLNIIDELNINLRIPQKNRIEIEIEGIKDKNKLFNTKFAQNWIAQSEK